MRLFLDLIRSSIALLEDGKLLDFFFFLIKSWLNFNIIIA